MSTVVATYPSSSNPTKSYDIVIVNEGKPDAHLYCNCPAWRNQKLDPVQRRCKHLDSYAISGGVLPRPIQTAQLTKPPMVVVDEFEVELQRAAESLSKMMR